MSQKMEQVFALCAEIADNTWRDYVEVTILNPKTWKPEDKEMTWPDFHSNFVRLDETDPESKRCLPAAPSLFHAKYVCEPMVGCGDRVTHQGRNGMEIWPVGGDKRRAAFISREQFVRFFFLLAHTTVPA